MPEQPAPKLQRVGIHIHLAMVVCPVCGLLCSHDIFPKIRYDFVKIFFVTSLFNALLSHFSHPLVCAARPRLAPSMLTSTRLLPTCLPTTLVSDLFFNINVYVTIKGKNKIILFKNLFVKIRTSRDDPNPYELCFMLKRIFSLLVFIISRITLPNG